MTSVKRKRKVRKPQLADNESCYPGFSYVPAAICLDQYNLALYIRYRSGRKSNHMRVRQKTASMIWIECPDRDIVVSSHAFDAHAFHPGDFDRCFHFDMFNQGTVHELGLNYVMPNFVHDQTDRARADSRSNGNIYPVGDPRRVTVIGDSGGFQYVSGKADWINPVDLAKWYNANVDAGMQLDIPLTLNLEKSTIDNFAALQNRNTKIIRANLDPHVDLVNVIHGKTPDQRFYYRDKIEAENGDLKRLALGGMATFGPLGIADTVTRMVDSGKKYSQYHLLGITSSNIFPVMIAMGEMGWGPHITSDSATHKISAKSRKQYMQFELGKLRTYDIGTKALAVQGSKGHLRPIVNRHFTCNCIVCSSLKYVDTLGVLNGPFTMSLLSIHNMIQTQRYVDMIKEVIQSEGLDRFIMFLRQSHATHTPKGNQDLINAIEYLRMYHNDSPKEAQYKYKQKLQRSYELYAEIPDDSMWGGSTGVGGKKKSEEIKRITKILDTSNKNLDRLEAGEQVSTQVAESSNGAKSVF